MEHKEYEERLILSCYGELDLDERAGLEAHLAECASCRSEQRRLMQLHDLLDAKPSEVSPQEVTAAREQLMRLVELDRRRQAASGGGGWGIPLRMAAAVGLVTLGVGMGHLMFSGSRPMDPFTADPFASNDIQIRNVQFQETGEAGGEVELSFLAARPVRVRGQVSDPKVQRLLAYALVNEQNPGVRLQAADAIRNRSDIGSDPDIRNALIAALQTDTNDGVRTKALQALVGYEVDSEVKSALLRVLRFDDNPKLRIQAIDLLESSLKPGAPVDDAVREVLRRSSETDDNNYIRLRARAVLQEVG